MRTQNLNYNQYNNTNFTGRLTKFSSKLDKVLVNKKKDRKHLVDMFYSITFAPAIERDVCVVLVNDFEKIFQKYLQNKK